MQEPKKKTGSVVAVRPLRRYGMFVQSEKFIEFHGGKLGDISIYGQEGNAATRLLAVMNLALSA